MTIGTVSSSASLRRNPDLFATCFVQKGDLLDLAVYRSIGGNQVNVFRCPVWMSTI
jgi:hypothetical protein